MSRPIGRSDRALVRSVMAAAAVAVSVVLGVPAPASADPAGPTDYRSEITLIDPPVPGIELAILGGDSFVELTADPGVEVLVKGYQGEPYLRFEADGSVVQNERSPARWLNDDRFGEAEIPPEADVEAEPRWVEVADDGRYAWHDHRAHWMNPGRPIGAEPGDTILEAVIPLSVDGRAAEVHVRSILLADPSPWPMIAGALVAAALAAVVAGGWRRRERVPTTRPVVPLIPIALWSVASAAIGLAAVAGLPAEAAPGPLSWLLPVAAAVVAGFGLLVASGRLLAPPLRPLVVPAAAVVAGTQLLTWVWSRRLALDRALIPTEAPGWLDRAVSSGAAVLGLLAVVVGAWALIGERAMGPRSAPRPTR